MFANLSDLLSENKLPFDLALLPEDTFLVGGAVRDALLGKPLAYLDLDFVIPEVAVEVARKIAKKYQAGFVVLDSKRHIARVVFPRVTVDFARQEGASIERDLGRRDYTMNAIAYRLADRKVVDPFDGKKDLERRLVRAVSESNLADDPLRLLRGFRQAAQLGFEIEPATVSAIARLAPSLAKVAGERARAEISHLLDVAGGWRCFRQAWENGLLDFWLPDATAASFERMAAIERAAHEIQQAFPTFDRHLYKPLRPTLKTNHLALAKLVALLPENPEPEALKPEDRETARSQLLQLKYGNVEIKLALLARKGWQRVRDKMSARSQYLFFQAAGEAFPATIVVAVAAGTSRSAWQLLLERYLDPEDTIAHPRPLLAGDDLLERCPMSPGPQVGRWLTALQLARAEGTVGDRETAIAWVRQQIAAGKTADDFL